MYILLLGNTVIRRNEHVGPLVQYALERFGQVFMDNYTNCIGCVGRSYTADGMIIEIMRI